MRYVAAYLLATLGGNQNPSKDDIEKILESVGVEVDAERLEKVIQELHGKSIDEVIAEGRSKLASVPSGGSVAVASGGSGETKGEVKEDKQEEKKKEEEPEEESDDDMGFGLFD